MVNARRNGRLFFAFDPALPGYCFVGVLVSVCTRAGPSLRSDMLKRYRANISLSLSYFGVGLKSLLP